MIEIVLIIGCIVNANLADPIQIDRIEFNNVYHVNDTERKTPKFRQMILWRWGRNGYEITDFIVLQEHTPICRGRNTVTIHARGDILSLRSRQIIDTTAVFDRERLDAATGRRRHHQLHFGTHRAFR
jgi:hypothetical protein